MADNDLKVSSDICYPNQSFVSENELVLFSYFNAIELSIIIHILVPVVFLYLIMKKATPEREQTRKAILAEIEKTKLAPDAPFHHGNFGRSKSLICIK